MTIAGDNGLGLNRQWRDALVPAALAIAIGLLAWELVRHLAHRSEAWDASLYWSLAYPFMVLASFLMGAVWRERPWRWPALIIGAQAVWTLLIDIATSGVPNLLPGGLFVFAVLSLPCLGAAYLGRTAGRTLAA